MSNFLEKVIEDDMKEGNRSHGKTITTRFPPEPNGFLHIGHAKSVLTNFGIAKKYNGQCNLRFDDTNPATEETEYVESIMNDVKWICQALDLPWCKDGKTAPWRDNIFYTSDYFQTLFDYAIELIKADKAYVDSQTAEEVQENRGGMQNGVDKPGKNSRFRDRSVEENLKLFNEMQEGLHEEGTHLVRAKIDMNHPNMNMRDPPIYRIKKMPHHRTGDKWNVYPIYDFAHGQSDAQEHITHSFCTLEFENHNELYRWFIDNIPSIASRPVQTEFARLNLEGAVMSKRRILRLVKEGKVLGWDDPRLMTIAAVRRRGIRPEGIKRFTDEIGVTNKDSVQPMALFDKCVMDDLDPISIRRMVVLDPLPVDIFSYEAGKTETIENCKSHPSDDSFGTRAMTFSNRVFIDRDDLDESAGSEFFRFSKVGTEVKLRNSYCIKLEEIIKDASGKVVSLKCSHDPATAAAMPSDRKVKGVIHWVDANNCLDVEVRLINSLFNAFPESGEYDFMDYINPKSMEIINGKAEMSLLENLKCSDRFQFERKGYFCPDNHMFDENNNLIKSSDAKLVFNRVVCLPESSAKKNMDGTNNKSRKEEQEKARLEKERLKQIAPVDYFKSEYADKYSKFDDTTGMPTHDAEGEELKKSALKKLQKELDKHKKLYESK